MTVSVEPQTAPQGRLTLELLFGQAEDVVDKALVRLVQLLQDARKREASSQLCICALKASMPPYFVE
jgi:hypothetical protein